MTPHRSLGEEQRRLLRIVGLMPLVSVSNLMSMPTTTSMRPPGGGAGGAGRSPGVSAVHDHSAVPRHGGW